MKHLLYHFSKKRYSVAFLLFSTFTLGMALQTTAFAQANPLADQIREKTTYGNLANLYLPSLTSKLMAEEEEFTKIQEHNAKAAQEKKLSEIQVPVIGQAEKIRVMLETFANHDYVTGNLITHQSVNSNTHQDLEMFCGNKPTFEKALFNQIDCTQTTVGKIELEKMVLNPTSDIKVLQKRQACVKELLNN
jgi:DNA mismatch repair ATPase MutS